MMVAKAGSKRVASTCETRAPKLGPWNPGIKSQLPTTFLRLSTIFRAENVFTGIEEAHERSAFTGLEPEDLVAFRPERLVVHELLIRVMADVSVRDGPEYADLGVNFRRIVETIHRSHIEPHMADIVHAYHQLRRHAAALIESELSSSLFAAATDSAREPAASGVLRLLGLGRKRQGPPPESIEDKERRILAEWQQRADASEEPLLTSTLRALARLAAALGVRHGRVRGDPVFLTALATDLVCNDHGSEMIGRMIEPHIETVVEASGYRLLPPRERPVVMNTKGASASGKSTMRGLQRELANALGLDWADFALISPDIWRKYLLDYSSLGEASKYAGSLTGHELRIIDQKLDRYMAQKAERTRISHLLIDRFRFDSFAEEEGGEEGARLLTRFGAVVYMFFMITPPIATVERAWKRGQEVGRYKAVEDLLDHNVEAYTGMPRLFFTWALRKDKQVHYEFLDNGVAAGERPRTVAFGWNDEMSILDIGCLLDIERFRKIDIAAQGPAEVHPDPAALAAENNTAFLLRCGRMIRKITLADHRTGRIYARIEAGTVSGIDPEALAAAMADHDTRVALLALAPGICEARAWPEPRWLSSQEQAHTIGRWGSAGAAAAR
jgi:hypothetical protein